LPEDRAEALSSVQAFIHATVPGLKETMAYNMPTFENTDIVCSLGSQKRYMALYVCATDMVKDFKEELAHLNCGKSCIRFKKVEDLPEAVIADILRASAEKPGYH
jgi:uncharacterized protein YdhG (YjbR/CyaY superfamily)